MPINSGLTIKEKKFAQSYVANGGNGTEAALTAYNTKKRQNAKQIAMRVLKREDVREEVQRILDKSQTPLKRAIDNISRLANETDVRPSADTVLKANQDILKLYSAYPEKVNKQISYSAKISYSEKNFDELIKLHKDKTEEIEAIINS